MKGIIPKGTGEWFVHNVTHNGGYLGIIRASDLVNAKGLAIERWPHIDPTVMTFTRVPMGNQAATLEKVAKMA